MGIYAICPECKDEQRFTFFDGACEHNPIYVCNNCDTEINADDFEEI